MSARPVTRHVVARAADVPPGARVIVNVGGHSIGVFNAGGEYFALLNHCPHQGAELCKGEIVGHLESDGPGEYRYEAQRRLLVCPWHGWEFDIRSGQSYCDPRRTRVRAYPVGVESGATIAGEPGAASGLVEGPYKVDVFPVEVEDDYLVVALR